MENEKNITFSVTLSPATMQTLKRIEEDSLLLSGLNVGRSKVITFVLSSYEKMQKDLEEVKATTKAEIAALMQSMLLSTHGGNTSKEKTVKLSYLEKKEVAEEAKKQKGIALCESMGGSVIGEICTFTKYEVTVGGRAISNTRSENIYNLSEKIVADQYYPDKMTWIAKKAQENANQ